MKLSIFRKAKKLLAEDKVKLVGTGSKAWYFQVTNRTETYNVTIEFEEGIRILPCSCRHGTMKGIKNYHCSHQLACLIWLYQKSTILSLITRATLRKYPRAILDS